MTIALVAVIFLSWNFTILGKEQEKSEIRQNKLLAVQEITVYGDRIQNILNMSFQYADFFEVLIARDQNLAEEIIEEYANIIMDQNKMIKNIGLAPEAIVTNIYPLEGNEEALGHNLLVCKSLSKAERTSKDRFFNGDSK